MEKTRQQELTRWLKQQSVISRRWLMMSRLLGVVSGIALALYMTAHRLLPLGLFGLLSYVEPILLLLAAMLLGERIQPGQEVMYFLIAAAVVVMAFEGLMQLRNKPGAS